MYIITFLYFNYFSKHLKDLFYWVKEVNVICYLIYVVIVVFPEEGLGF